MLLLTLLFENSANVGMNGPMNVWFPGMPMVVHIVIWVLTLLAAYLLGGFNTAIVLSKKMYSEDVRDYGSGNAGFTNMMRTYGKKAAMLTMLGDFLKTVIAIMLGWFFLGYHGAYFAALACMIGHIFPIMYKGKGGKGVMCFATALLTLDFRMFLIEFALFVLIVLISKYISLGSVICVMTTPLFFHRMGILGQKFGIITLTIIAMAILIVFKHAGNLKRISQGKENKFSFKKSKKKEETADAAEDAEGAGQDGAAEE